jgi:transposase-like protein
MSTEVRTRTVLEVLSGRQTVATAAARLGVTRQTIYNWQAEFVAAGSERLAADRRGAMATSVADRTTPRVEAVVVSIVERLRRLAGPHEVDIATLEAIRTGAGLPVSRFCALIGVPRRTYYTRRAGPAAAPTAPAQQRIDGTLAELRARHPAWGARRLWRHLTDVEGTDVSLATVKRALARHILTEGRQLSS